MYRIKPFEWLTKMATVTITNPSGDTQLLAQDIVILIGTRECIAGVTGVVLSSIS